MQVVGIVMELVVQAVAIRVIVGARTTGLWFVQCGGAGGLILSGGSFLACVWPFGRWLIVLYVLFFNGNTFAFTLARFKYVTHFTRTISAAGAVLTVSIGK